VRQAPRCGRPGPQPAKHSPRRTNRPLRPSLGRAILDMREPARTWWVISLLRGDHLLLEAFPVLGKTELIKSLSKTCWDCRFRRVQFYGPDLLQVYHRFRRFSRRGNGRRQLVFHQGPIFAISCWPDEINRGQPQNQSALLETNVRIGRDGAGRDASALCPFYVRPRKPDRARRHVPASRSPA